MVGKYTEEQIKIAIDEVRSAEKSVRRPETDNRLPRTTLTSRLSSNYEMPVVGRPFMFAIKAQLISDRVIQRALICCPVTKRELLGTIREVYNKV